MFFKKKPNLDTPMAQFLHRRDLNVDERAVLDVYLSGVSHALTELHAVRAVMRRFQAWPATTQTR